MDNESWHADSFHMLHALGELLTAAKAFPMAASTGPGACRSLRPAGEAVPWQTKVWPLTSTVKLSGVAGGAALAATQPKVSGRPPAGRGLSAFAGEAVGPEYGCVAKRQYESSDGE